MSRAFFATIACISIALLLAGCGNNATGGAPSHSDAWLSFKYNNDAPGCGTVTQCSELQGSTASSGNTEAASYYQVIGAESPTGPALTLTQWEANFGMPATQMASGTNGPGYAHATYGNALDLQLGRDMYCWQTSQTTFGPVVACYVSNYGPAPWDQTTTLENTEWPNLESAIDCAIAKGFQAPCTLTPDGATPQQPFATVAMAYTANGIGPNNDKVSFYVFDQNGILTVDAALDGEGPKTVPRMCMACHGGTYSTTSHSVSAALGGGHTASFLPFDVQSFAYSQDVPGYDLDSQQEALRQLNNLVASTNPAPAIANLINGLYSGSVATPGTTIPNDTYVPSNSQTGDWSANPTVYKGVFRDYCRMCHLAQDPPADFSSYSEFQGLAGGVSSLVCGSVHDMPHAEVPFGGLAGSTQFSNSGLGFWWDPKAILDLNSFLQTTPFQGLPCAQP
jgi:hypothetical protein